MADKSQPCHLYESPTNHLVALAMLIGSIFRPGETGRPTMSALSEDSETSNNPMSLLQMFT